MIDDKPVPLFVRQIEASKKVVPPAPKMLARDVLYEQISAVVVANPGKDEEWFARKLNMDQGRLRKVMLRPEFVDVLTKRRDRMCGEVMKEAIIANHGLHLDAVYQAKNRVNSMEDDDLVKLVEVTGRNLGLHRDNKANVAVQNNFVVKWLTDDTIPG